ncbi:hypothetical protein E0H53_09510 [Rhizobium leguminosarum bv. viciae]|uniref:hypothetical protein n=1 Tax=Rhizobium leguminosarum TaxID=384 RepID=UPI00103B0931|nr:hypothetical protein [Rhizobium leguminosarum]TBZ89999.1 hypothetical protein E0H53_09510 [Rhizobium leguminosarum bv. viciae]
MWNFVQSLQQPPVQAAVITATATCLSALIGFTAVFIQIGRQGRNAIKANTKNEELKRKVEIYERMLEATRTAAVAALDVTGYLGRFRSSLDLRDVFPQWGKMHPPAERYVEYQGLYNEASTGFIGVITVIESWHIIEPKLDVFSLAISAGLDELRKTDRAPNLIMKAMPFPGHESSWAMPDAVERKALEELIDQKTFEINRLSAWVADFQVEMQVLLLGDLFLKPIVRRNPPDPKQFCISLDRYEEVKRKLHAFDFIRRGEELDAQQRAHFAKNKS